MNSNNCPKILSITYGFVNKNRGTPIRIFSLMHGLAAYSDMDLYTASLDTEPFVSGVPHFILPKSKIKAIFSIYQFISKNKIDILVGHTLLSYSLLIPLKFITRKKIVLEMHGFVEEEWLLTKKIGYFSYLRIKYKHSKIYKFFDLVTTCSDTATEILSNLNSNVVTIFGGCDVKTFNPDVAATFSFKHNSQDIILGYAGNTRSWQGLDFLIETFSELRKVDQRFKLVLLLSESYDFEQAPGITVVSGLKHSEVPGFLASCDILIIPRLSNRVNDISFPSKLPEYLAMGKPVVASSTSDSFRVIEDGVNGFLFAPGDKSGFKNTLVNLADFNLREKIGKNARQISTDKLCWEKQVEIFHIELLKLVVSSLEAGKRVYDTNIT